MTNTSTLRQMGLKIGRKMRNTTSKYRVGFGGFSEKPVPPFSARDHNPVNFVHYLDLTQDLGRENWVRVGDWWFFL